MGILLLIIPASALRCSSAVTWIVILDINASKMAITLRAWAVQLPEQKPVAMGPVFLVPERIVAPAHLTAVTVHLIIVAILSVIQVKIMPIVPVIVRRFVAMEL